MICGYGYSNEQHVFACAVDVDVSEATTALKLNYEIVCRSIVNSFDTADDIERYLKIVTEAGMCGDITSATQKDIYGNGIFESLINRYLATTKPISVCINAKYGLCITTLLKNKCFVDMTHLRELLPSFADLPRSTIQKCFRDHYNIDIL